MKHFSQSAIKLLMLFVGLFALAPLANAYNFTAGSTLYVEFLNNGDNGSEGNWTKADAVIYAQFFGSSDSAWLKLTQVNGNVYRVTVPSDNPKMNLVRVGPSGDPAKPDDCWNSIYNITAPNPSDNTNLIKYQGWNNGTVTWSHYDDYVTPSQVYIIGTIVPDTPSNDWPGHQVAMTKSETGNVWTYTTNGQAGGHFAFVTNNGNTWDLINQSDRYGADKESTSVTIDKAMPITVYSKKADSNHQPSASHSWQIPTGKYTFTLDFDAKTLTVVDNTYAYDYYVKFWNNGDKVVQFKNGAFTVKGSEIKGKGFGIAAVTKGKSYTGVEDSEDVWYSSNSSSNVSVSKDAISEFELKIKGTNFSASDLYDGWQYAFTLLVDDEGKATGLRVVPIKPANAGKVYLLGKILNNYYESPAWEMKKQTDGTYFLDKFAMRDQKGNGLKLRIYDINGSYSDKDVNSSGFNHSYDSRQPGWLCTATWDGSSNIVNFTEIKSDDSNLDETSKKLSSFLPYIGVLGKNFRQARNYETREKCTHNYGYGDVETMGHTDDGWQEAYVEYDEFGKPLTDSKGQAYYNTVWPPRNNILLQSYLGEDVDPLNISTASLTMKRDERGIMKGKDWRDKLQAENPDEYKTDYGDDLGFKLEDNQNYARYVIENVWMMGEYKIWSGWNGEKASNNDNQWAQWDHHVFFGPGGTGDTPSLNKWKKVHQTYNIYGDTNNFNTKDNTPDNHGDNDYAREFYHTMEIFLPVTDAKDNYVYLSNESKWQPRFYHTEAAAGAQIDAVARNNELVGYAPELTSFPSDYHVTKYTVTRYRYDVSGDINKHVPVTKDGTLTSYGNAQVVAKTLSDASIGDAQKFANEFTMDSENFDGKYVNDGVYEPGLYVFRLEVELEHNSNGTKKSADVWSPYVQIFEVDGKIEMEQSQLIELPANSDFNGYDYITYNEVSKDNNCGAFSATVVKVDSNDKVVELKEVINDAETNNIVKIYESEGAWTNKSLLLVSDPANFNGTATSFAISKNNAERAAATRLVSLMNNSCKIGDVNAYIDDNGTNLKETSYIANFNGQLTAGPEGSGSATVKTEANVTYVPTFMLPALKTAVLSYGDNTDASDMTATHEHVKYMVENSNGWTNQQTVNAHHNCFGVKVPVQMPNISTATSGLKNAVYTALSVKLNLDDYADAFVLTPANNATDYALNYTYQSPYDWMKYNEDTQKWEATAHSWNLGNSSYNNATTAIAGVFPTLDASYETSATLAPAFKAPEFDYIPGSENKIWFGSKVDGDEDGNGFDIEIFIKQINAKTQEGNKLADGVNLNAGNHDALVLLISTSIAEKADRIVSKVVKVSDLENSANTHTIVKYHSTAKNYGELYWDLQNWFNEYVKIEAAYAYYFDSEGADGTSEFSGFTGTFPGIRYDKKPANGSSKAAPSQSDSSATLAAGDNSFLLAPAYTVLMAEGDGIMTGVDDIIDAAGNVTVGEGFIDLNGNNGMVFSADGCMVYSGAARCEVEKGVYVVTVNGKSTKVIVK